MPSLPRSGRSRMGVRMIMPMGATMMCRALMPMMIMGVPPLQPRLMRTLLVQAVRRPSRTLHQIELNGGDLPVTRLPARRAICFLLIILDTAHPIKRTAFITKIRINWHDFIPRKRIRGAEAPPFLALPIQVSNARSLGFTIRVGPFAFGLISKSKI